MAARSGLERVLGGREVWMQLKDRQELRRLMQRQQWSVRRLAEACDLSSHSMIQQLRTGERSSCTPELAQKIADSLGVQRRLLFEVETSRGTPQVMKRAAHGTAAPVGAS